MPIEPVRPMTRMPLSPSRSATTRARSSASTVGRTPNQRSKPGTAWCSSMPRPSTIVSPLPRAAAQERRHERHVDEVGRDRIRCARRPGDGERPPPPCRPAEVALTMRSACGKRVRQIARARRRTPGAPKCRGQRLGARRRAVQHDRPTRSRARSAPAERRATRRRRRSPAPCEPRRQSGARSSRLAGKP